MENEKIYQQFLKENPKFGKLRVQVYMSNQAIPISGVNIKVEKEIEKQIFTFYEGKTDESGIIDNIELPAPNIIDINMPNYTTYTLSVEHPSYQKTPIFTIPVYHNQKMIQYVNLIPLYKESSNG